MTKQSSTVADGLVVSLHYTLRLDDGQIVDSSIGEEPLAYLQGYGQIIPGLEKELVGMALNDEKDLEIPPAEAYGEVDKEAFELVSRDIFPEDLKLEIGLNLSLRDLETNEPYEAVVADVQDEEVLLDFNHPLAGETLYFHVQIAGLRPATSEELNHGHAH